MPFIDRDYEKYCESNFKEGLAKMTDEQINKILEILQDHKCPEEGCEKCIMHLAFFVGPSKCMTNILYKEKVERMERKLCVI